MNPKTLSAKTPRFILSKEERKLTRIFNRCDPEGLISEGAAVDEYHPEVDALAFLLWKNGFLTEQDVADVLLYYFGYGTTPKGEKKRLPLREWQLKAWRKPMGAVKKVFGKHKDRLKHEKEKLRSNSQEKDTAQEKR